MGVSFFSGIVSIELLDSVSCALLAAGAVSRARGMGANLMGALVLGCICGLSGPLAREALAHGHAGMRMVMAALPDDALVGAFGGLAATFIARQNPQKLFLWLDAWGMSLACALGTIMGLPESGGAGAVVTGLVNGVTPGLLRDVSLGDIALLVEKKWYAASGIVACVIAVLIVFVPIFTEMPRETRLGEWAVAAGCLSGACLLIWKGGIDDIY